MAGDAQAGVPASPPYQTPYAFMAPTAASTSRIGIVTSHTTAPWSMLSSARPAPPTFPATHPPIAYAMDDPNTLMTPESHLVPIHHARLSLRPDGGPEKAEEGSGSEGRQGPDPDCRPFTGQLTGTTVVLTSALSSSHGVAGLTTRPFPRARVPAFCRSLPWRQQLGGNLDPPNALAVH